MALTDYEKRVMLARDNLAPFLATDALVMTRRDIVHGCHMYQAQISRAASVALDDFDLMVWLHGDPSHMGIVTRGDLGDVIGVLATVFTD